MATEMLQNDFLTVAATTNTNVDDQNMSNMTVISHSQRNASSITIMKVNKTATKGAAASKSKATTSGGLNIVNDVDKDELKGIFERRRTQDFVVANENEAKSSVVPKKSPSMVDKKPYLLPWEIKSKDYKSEWSLFFIIRGL